MCNRIDIYYLAQGRDLKHSGVIYDRTDSSFSELQPRMIDWNEVLKDVKAGFILVLLVLL